MSIPPIITPDVFDLYKKMVNALAMGDYSNQIIHYTGIDTLERILNSNELWFGNTAEMNDTSECDHFIDAVLGKSSYILGGVEIPTIKNMIAQMRPAIRNSTYISSWCEYFDAEPNGKLSMWRNYADGGKGVGLIVDSSPLQPSTVTLQRLGFFIYNAKVTYVKENRAIEIANDYIRRIVSIPELKGSINASMFIAHFILGMAPTIKHDGFQEEEEIRFLNMQGLRKIMYNTNHADGKIKTLGNGANARSFYALPLKNYNQYGFDLRIGTILKKVIVGPAANRNDRVLEVRNMLDRFNLSHVDVIVSNIPYR